VLATDSNNLNYRSDSNLEHPTALSAATLSLSSILRFFLLIARNLSFPFPHRKKQQSGVLQICGEKSFTSAAG